MAEIPAAHKNAATRRNDVPTEVSERIAPDFNHSLVASSEVVGGYDQNTVLFGRLHAFDVLRSAGAASLSQPRLALA